MLLKNTKYFARYRKKSYAYMLMNFMLLKNNFAKCPNKSIYAYEFHAFKKNYENLMNFMLLKRNKFCKVQKKAYRMLIK